MKKLKLPQKVRSFLARVRRVLLAPEPIGGLSISDTSLKFLLIKGNSIVQASLKIPPGIIETGRVKNKKDFVAALQNIHEQVAPLKKPLPVILTLPSSLVYSQPFLVPLVDQKHIEESIGLNMQMISPHKIEKSYYDWQEIRFLPEKHQMELLGAFTESDIVNEYEASLRAANFNLVAVEFPGLALTRLLQQRWSALSKDSNYLLVYINGDGVLVLILKQGDLFFHHFNSWQEILRDQPQKTITFENVQKILSSEIRRVLNYYLGKFGAPLKEMILISPVFTDEIIELGKKEFNIAVRNLTIPELPNLKPNWFSPLGTALRGLMTRPNDSGITLTRGEAQKEYYHERILHFIGIWRNILIGTLIFVIISFTVIDTAFLKEERRLAEKVTSEFSANDLQKDDLLQKRITDFNSLLGLIEETAVLENSWSNFIVALNGLAGSDITLGRTVANQNNGSVLINGSAKNEGAAIAFKNRLIAHPLITNVELPLSNIRQQPDGSVVFTVTMVTSSFVF